MAGDPCDADVLLVSVAWGGDAYNIATGAAYECAIQDVAIRGEGVIGPSCRGAVAGDLTAVVDFLVKPAFDPIANKNTTGDLVITCTQADGGTTVHTCDDMIPRGYAFAIDRDSPPARWRQNFVYQGDMDEDPTS